MVQVGGLYLILHYVTMLVLAALTLLSHMNQFCCGSCAIYAWPVDTSLNLASLWLTPIPHSLMYLPDHWHPVYLVGSWYIRLGYSFRLFNFWRHIMTLYIYIYLPLNSPLPALAVKTDKDHWLHSGPGLTLCRAIHIVIWNQLPLQNLASYSYITDGCSNQWFNFFYFQK